MRIPVQLVLMLVFPLSTFAQGGPPLLTDDPGTPGNGHYEINSALTANYRKGEHEFEAPLIDMNFGMTDRGQLKIEVPLVIDRADGQHTKSGMGDVMLGWKWRFLDQDNALVDVSVYPQVSFSPSSRSKRIGLAERGIGLLLPLEIAHDFGNLSVAAEIGHTIRTQNSGESLFGVALGWKRSNKMEWLTEYHQVLSTDQGEKDSLVNIGFRREILSRVNLLTSIGTSLDTTNPDRTKLAFYFGLQFNN